MYQSTIMGFKHCKPTLTYYIIQRYFGRRPTNIVLVRVQSTELFINCMLAYKLRDRISVQQRRIIWEYYIHRETLGLLF